MIKYEIPDAFKPFFNTVKRKCKANKVSLVLSPSKNVVITDSFSTDCSGYFDDYDKALVVACGKPFEEWIEILVHEYSHMEQWIEDDRWKYWTDCCGDLWAWLDREKMMNSAQVDKIVDGMIELERDCEVRAVANIRKFNLPINKSEYQRKSNLYLYSYRMMKKIKKFPTGIYYNKELVSMCPTKIRSNYDSVPKEIYDMILKLYS